jgi:hypothetical protein
MLSMHLLQSTLVLMNTLLVQNVLAEPEWSTDADPPTGAASHPCSGPTSTPTARLPRHRATGSSSGPRSHPTSQPRSHSPLLCPWGQLPKEMAFTERYFSDMTALPPRWASRRPVSAEERQGCLGREGALPRDRPFLAQQQPPRRHSALSCLSTCSGLTTDSSNSRFGCESETNPQHSTSQRPRLTQARTDPLSFDRRSTAPAVDGRPAGYSVPGGRARLGRVLQQLLGLAAFGSEGIERNDPAELEKMIKFNTLLANCVIIQIALFAIQKRGRAFASLLALLKGGGMIETTAAARSLRDPRRGEPSLSLSLSGALLAHDELASNGRDSAVTRRRRGFLSQHR